MPVVLMALSQTSPISRVLQSLRENANYELGSPENRHGFNCVRTRPPERQGKSRMYQFDYNRL